MISVEAGPPSGRAWAYLASAAAAALAGAFVLCLPQVVDGGRLVFDVDWVPSLGISLGFLIDGLSLIFALLISGIGAAVFLYAAGYMGGHPRFGLFVALLFAFMLSMLGLVLARDLITLFVFWELTSVFSWLLIGFNHEDPLARRNALQALLVTSGGGLALLAGLVLIGQAAGSQDLVTILKGGSLAGVPLYPAILALVLLGAFTKSAQFPFHFWLPNAMAAPTPVSAYLHSATMVKGGIYLLARLHPVLGGTSAWGVALTAAGLVTTVMAAVIALRQTDLKQALAWTTLTSLGTITLFLAGDGPPTLTAAITFLVVHSLYKAALFMVVGAIEHGTGTRDATRLGGLRRAMPLTALAAGLAGLSMAGLPPTIGWIGKELLYAGAATLTPAPLIAAGILLANALMVAVAGAVALRPFWGREGAPPRPGHEVSWQMLAGPLVLGTMGLIFGLLPDLPGAMVGAAVTGGLGQPHADGLHLWAGVGLPLGLSIATFALGFALYLGRGAWRRRVGALLARMPSFDAGWDSFLGGFRAFAGWQVRVIQTGRATGYLAATFAVLALAIGATLVLKRPAMVLDLSAPPLIWLIAGFTVAGAALTLTPHSRIANIAGIGTTGIGVALVFIVFGAPDVATTQLMVETLSAVLFAIAMLRLPGIVERRSRSRQIAHGVLACAVGLGVILTLLAVTAHPLDRRITTFFEAGSYVLAHGRNIVNVVLVDFRAFDTFGELTVVLLAGIGAHALLKRGKGGRRG